MRCYICTKEIALQEIICPYCGTLQKKVIEDAKNGEIIAIEDLYKITYNSVYKTIKVLIKDEDTVLDILQDTYIKCFKNLNQLENPESFLPWLKRISVNNSKNWLKKKKAVLFTDLTQDEGDIENFFEDEQITQQPEQVIDQKETSRLLDEILNTLSEDQRLVIGMYYYEEMSVKEIAEILECSENTVKSRLNYGRQKIKAKVLELEKQGTKLYSLAPIGFLKFLLSGMDKQTKILPSEAILKAVETECIHLGKTVTKEAVQSTLLKEAKTKSAETIIQTNVTSTSQTVAKSVATSAAKKSILSVAPYFVAPTVAVTAVTVGLASAIISNNGNNISETPTTVIESQTETVLEETVEIPETVIDYGTIDQYVVTFREEHINYDTFSTFNGLTFGNSYDFYCRIPAISIDSEDAQQCNNEIQQTFVPVLDNACDAQNEKYDCVISQLDYEAWIYEDMVIVVISSSSKSNYTNYESYVFDINSGTQLNNSAIIEKWNLKDFYTVIAVENMKQKYEELYAHSKDVVGDFYSTQLARTLDATNAQKVCLYPDENGNLQMLCTIYSIAGAESYEYLIPVTY